MPNNTKNENKVSKNLKIPFLGSCRHSGKEASEMPVS